MDSNERIDDNDNDSQTNVQQMEVSDSNTMRSVKEKNSRLINDNNKNENRESIDPYDGKRQKSSPQKSPIPSSSSYSGMALFPNSIPASPPRFVSFEEIMKAAKGVENMVIAHEIAIDNDFKLEKVESQKNTVEHQVKEIMHRAFWDVLKEQLNESPPNYTQSMVLLQEVKESILSLLLPQHTRLRQEIDEILDLELIQQQTENDALEFDRYSNYILSVCSRLCAPIRDETIRQLTQTKDIVTLYRGIFELLDVMRLDMANFHIKQLRPHIQQKSVEYEREKFKEFLETQSELSGIDGLEHTKIWLKKNYEMLDFEPDVTAPNVINKVLVNAYLELLLWDKTMQESYPETLLIDIVRFETLKEQIYKYTIIGCIMLVTNATIGPSIQGLQEFRDTLKDHLLLLLSDIKSDNDNDVTKSHLTSASIQVIDEVKKCLEKHTPNTLDQSKISSLETQIIEIANKDNRIRKVVERRIIEFVEGVLSSPTAAPMQIPAGLSVLQNELSGVAGQFICLVGHNRAVFKDYYADIIMKLAPHLQSSQQFN